MIAESEAFEHMPSHFVTAMDSKLAEWERCTPFNGFLLDEALRTISNLDDNSKQSLHVITELADLLNDGRYVDVLRSQSSVVHSLFCAVDKNETCGSNQGVKEILQSRVVEIGKESLYSCIILELLAVASLQLFLQANYTGPTLSDSDLDDFNPHSSFHATLEAHQQNSDPGGIHHEKANGESTNRSQQLNNAILSELAVDWEWPCQVCKFPYFFLVSRTVLDALSQPSRLDWTKLPSGKSSSNLDTVEAQHIPMDFSRNATKLRGVHWWNSRSCVAHHRLVSTRRWRHSPTLWTEVNGSFEKCLKIYNGGSKETLTDKNYNNESVAAATVQLEWGLAQYYFSRSLPTSDGSKAAFIEALKQTGLSLHVTGAMGKRTKFQQEAKAQMVVHAESKTTTFQSNEPSPSADESELIKKQMIEHAEDGILLERIKFDEEEKNEIRNLTITDQSILLALCLDVKNNNPADGLTEGEMSAYLARVLDHHDDWMIYSTALLERAWLEFERNHARERAILQLQALVDQHTNRLTITQSTRESIESSATVQERLLHLHSIVYPPRWAMFQDLAARYENLGIVSSAAELYLEIEEWDSVVDCYRRAGRLSHAEKIVRKRLAINETPRMWAALGDLTKEPVHYEKAIALSNGRFADAYLALGEHYFEKGELEIASQQYEKALKVRPLNAPAWFRFGAINMQLCRWQAALRSFSEVVLQRPEEAEAWANIAAIHMQNKSPTEAYPALNESLKYQRSNWRVWISKLYICLDLEKFDEAILACNTLLDLRSQRQASDKIPPLEEKCVRAIVGGTIKEYNHAVSKNDDAAVDSSRRTLSRVHGLLDRLNSSADTTSWILETTTYFHQRTGQDSAKVLETLSKEYRALQTNVLWEKDDALVRKVCQVVSHMVHLSISQGTREGLVQSRFLLRGTIQKVRTARPDDDSIPSEIQRLEQALLDVNEKISAL
jgi:tetratricopeptide (TPR) repeat protein